MQQYISPTRLSGSRNDNPSAPLIFPFAVQTSHIQPVIIQSHIAHFRSPSRRPLAPFFASIGVGNNRSRHPVPDRWDKSCTRLGWVSVGAVGLVLRRGIITQRCLTSIEPMLNPSTRIMVKRDFAPYPELRRHTRIEY